MISNNNVTHTNLLSGNPSYFNNLDALRFFSFFSVFLSHTLRLPDTGNNFTEILLNVLLMNYLGVPFFFSLSSFLITYRLLKEREKNGHIRLLNFYRNRILRIWPAYYIIIIICFALLPLAATLLHAPSPSLPPLLPFVFFYVNFHIIQNGEFFTFALAILWSISVEEQFYIVWGFLMKLASRNTIRILIPLLFLISVAFSYYYLSRYPRSSNNLAIHSLFILQNFCTGAWAAYSCFQKRNLVIPPGARRLLFAAAYFVLPLCYLFTKDFIIFNILKSTCYGLIIYDQSFNQDRIFNAGNSGIINYLGKISYGLYLYHALVKVILQTQFHFFGAAAQASLLQNILHSFIALIVTVLVAHLSYRYIESRFLAMKTA